MARKKKKKQKQAGDSGPKGAPEWIVTFTDMVSLLVTFFVLLMTFSSLDDRELLKVASWLDRTESALQEKPGDIVQEAPREDLLAAKDLQRGANRPHSRPQEHLVDNMEEMGQKLTEDHIAIDLNEVPDGLVIEFGPKASFAPGSVELTPELARSLREAARVLENYPYLVVVEGFADGAFKPTARFATPEAISCARAVAAASEMLRASDMDARMLQVAGLGSQHPRAENDSPEGRQMNRRVQIRILSLSKLRAAHIEVLRKAEDRNR